MKSIPPTSAAIVFAFAYFTGSGGGRASLIPTPFPGSATVVPSYTHTHKVSRNFLFTPNTNCLCTKAGHIDFSEREAETSGFYANLDNPFWLGH